MHNGKHIQIFQINHTELRLASSLSQSAETFLTLIVPTCSVPRSCTHGVIGAAPQYELQQLVQKTSSPTKNYTDFLSSFRY